MFCSLTRRLFLFTLLSGLLAAGCGPRRPALLPVDGRITLNDKPVENAAVMFLADVGGRPATGITDADGYYRLTTFDTDDGCVLGKQRVCVVLNIIEGSAGTMTPEGAVSGSGLIKTTWLVPERYSNVETSGLTAEVARGSTTFEFHLKSDP
jgi:hypothetical protein